ncbi:MAG: hypothetical protein GX100_02595, partial [candidate division WS1 bacterium]|nr:hypothetical protein [candidate division WS1 bacterium]
VKFGQPNTLRLFSGRLGLGIQSLDRVSKAVGDYYASRDPERTWLTTGIGLICPADEFYLEARSPQVYVENTWYQTFTRGMQRVEPVITLQATQPISDLTAKVVIHDSVTGAAVKEKSVALPNLPRGESKHRIVMPAGELKRWGLYEPNLYFGQVTLIDEKGQELDRTPPTRFGLREVWAQGRLLYLNDGPVYFVCGPNPSENNVDQFMELGITMFSFGVPYWGRFLSEDTVPVAEMLDRKGAAYTTTGVSMSEMPMTDPEFLQDYDLWVRAYARRYQNHPSVFIYGLGYNTPGSWPDFIPTRVGRTETIDWGNAFTTLARTFSLRADPTRLYYYYGGARGPDFWSANCYPNHAPTQEVEEWFSYWHEKGDRPVITFESTTGTMAWVDYERNYIPFGTEYAAIKAGDEAYDEESDEYLAYVNHTRARLEFWGLNMESVAPLLVAQKNEARVRTTRAWRFWGVPFYNWDYMGEVYQPPKPPTGPRDLDGLRRNSLAWIGGPPEAWPAKDHNFFAGDRITKSLMLLRDRSGTDTWKLAWEVKLTGQDKPFASGSFDQNIGAYARLKVPVTFTAPEVTAPAHGVMSFTAQDGSGNEIGTDRIDLTIYPRPSVPAAERSAPFAIYDPEGQTTAWLKARGANLAPYDPASRQRPGVLILGRRALAGLKAVPFTAEQVAAGMRVVIFEQHCNDLGNLGLQHEDRSPRYVFIRQPQHPLATGLTPDGLRDWQDAATLISRGPEGDRVAISSRLARCGNRGSVASVIIETPHFGPFLPVLDCEFDLGYSPLLSWRHGTGEVLFCQLDLTGRIGQEPGATQVADNLLRYLRQPPKISQVKRAVCLDEPTRERLEALGFAAVVLGERLNPSTDVAVVMGDQAAAFAARRKQLVDFANAGGQVLILYASEQLLADSAFGSKLKVEETIVTRAGSRVEQHPLLTGVGPQNIHWRFPVKLLKLTSEDRDFTSLLGGLAGVQRMGKGSFVFFQVEPVAFSDLTAVKAEDAEIVAAMKEKKTPLPDKEISDAWFLRNGMRSRWQVNKLHSLLLTNLGLGSSAELTRRLFTVSRPIPVSPVNAFMVFGPIPPEDLQTAPSGGSPMNRADLTQFASHRDPAYRMQTARGETIRWYTPTDSQNGYGLDGKNDWAKIWGVRVRDLGIGVAYLWSTREREATIGVGADWWLRVDVNGEEVFNSDQDGFGVGFDLKKTVQLKAGWNELVVYLGAGSNGHYFNLQITNPGDLVVAQQLTPPKAPPESLPPVSELLPEESELGFSLYSEVLEARNDPYAYYAW